MLDLMQFRLAESIDNTNILENISRFIRLCHANRIKIKFGCYQSISEIYAVNVALDCLCDGVGNGILC